MYLEFVTNPSGPVKSGGVAVSLVMCVLFSCVRFQAPTGAKAPEGAIRLGINCQSVSSSSAKAMWQIDLKF